MDVMVGPGPPADLSTLWLFLLRPWGTKLGIFPAKSVGKSMGKSMGMSNAGRRSGAAPAWLGFREHVPRNPPVSMGFSGS